MTSRKTLVAPPDVLLLLDPTERKNAIDSFRENNGSPEMEKTIIKYLVEPLEEWADSEYRKYGHHEGIEFALKLAIRGRDIAEKWSDGITVVPEQIDALESEWQKLNESMGFASADLWAKEDSRRGTGRKKAGKAKAGYVAPLGLAILEYIKNAKPNTFNDMLSEMELDADEEKESFFYELRERQLSTVKFVSVDASEVCYKEGINKEIKSISTDSLRTKMSNLKRK